MSHGQIVTCNHCGANYQLSAEYLAQYGGQLTKCNQCQNPFTIPRPASGPLPLPSDNAIPFATVAPVLGYRGVDANPAPEGVWREGTQLVLAKDATLPFRCIKCNGEPDGIPRVRQLYWHHPAVYIAVIQPIIYIILALVLRKYGSVTLFLCRRHASRRRWIIAGGWLSVPAAIGLFITAGYLNFPALFVPLGILTFLTGTIGGVIGSRIVVPSLIDDQYIWLRGAGPAYLDSISS